MDPRLPRGPVLRDADSGPPVTVPSGELPQIVAYDNDGLLVDHIHIFGNVTDLGKWGNSISSMVIVAGRWEFWLFAIIEAGSKSLRNRPISFFSGCVHFAIQRPGVESA
jgi:hypothetical protein